MRLLSSGTLGVPKFTTTLLQVNLTADSIAVDDPAFRYDNPHMEEDDQSKAA